MQQTILRDEQEVQNRQPTTNKEPSDSDLYAGGMTEGSCSYPITEPSGGLLGTTYERFLGLPVLVVLTALWLAGIALLGSCVLALYVLATLSAQMVTGT